MQSWYRNSSALCFSFFHVVERVVVGIIHDSSVETSVPSFGGGGFLGLLIVASITFLSLLPFFASKNISRAIGHERVKEILFRYPKEAI